MPGGGASNLGKYLLKKDKYGVKVGELAEQCSSGVAKCKLCLDCKIDLKKGLEKLVRHSETDKHRKNTPKVNEASKQVIREETLDRTQLQLADLRISNLKTLLTS